MCCVQAIPDSPGFRVPWFGRSRGKGGPLPGSRGRRGRGSFERGGGRRGIRRAWSGGLPLDEYQGVGHEEGLSVEDIVNMCQQLPPGKPVPEAAYQALFHFDSRATALLLKDLSKAGLGARAVEMFDWLRNLDAGHPLGALCDVYTYTAMISMCIYQQVCRLPAMHACMHACALQQCSTCWWACSTPHRTLYAAVHARDSKTVLPGMLHECMLTAPHGARQPLCMLCGSCSRLSPYMMAAWTHAEAPCLGPHARVLRCSKSFSVPECRS